jgi:DNA-binding NtrC family response regulator
MDSILLIEDQSGIRTLLVRWTAAMGYPVRQAANAEEALEQMACEASAVAVCDILLPGHDGLWLAEQLRHDYPATAVILATSVSDVNTVIRSLRIGAVDYLVKPFTPDRLRDALQRGIDCHRTRMRAPRSGQVPRTPLDDPAQQP